MNRLFLLLLLPLFAINSAISQDYINIIKYPFADSVNHFDLEWFQNNNTRLYGYKRGDDIVIPARYDFTNGFSKKGIARVTLSSPNSDICISPLIMGTYTSSNIMIDNWGLNGFIDTLGNIVIPIRYSSIGLIEVYDVVPYSLYIKENGKSVQKHGLINDKGKIIVEPIYDFISKRDKIFLASIYKEDEEDYFYLDDTGKELGKDGMFDKFVVISECYPQVFYVENKGTAYLIDQNFTSYTTPYQLKGEDEKVVQKKLLEKYLEDQKASLQEVRNLLNRVKYSPNIK